MSAVDVVDDMVREQKRGNARGLPSICSAHPNVLRTAVRRAVQKGGPVLIEATCNQVNQHGGYTGMTPAAFAGDLSDMAREEGLPRERLLLGGDHLGPYVWRALPAAAAMREAETLVGRYVQAGFVKIHLDASMRLGDDDPAQPLDVSVASHRAARLARIAEAASDLQAEMAAPRYVLGTEVPAPGGSIEHDRHVEITSVSAVRDAIDAAREAFKHEGLDSAWDRVIAIVVQPGVEFGPDYIVDYDGQAARALSRFIETEPRIVYEAHSTDYQRQAALRAMVRDHFALLKVGPALTNAFRESVFALAMIEAEMLSGPRRGESSRFIEVLDAAMLRAPEHWVRHYRGTPEEVALARKYSLSDRSRYYWNDEPVRRALQVLIANLSRRPIPLSLLSQFLPGQCMRIREGVLDNAPQALLTDRIDQILDGYSSSCGQD